MNFEIGRGNYTKNAIYLVDFDLKESENEKKITNNIALAYAIRRSSSIWDRHARCHPMLDQKG